MAAEMIEIGQTLQKTLYASALACSEMNFASAMAGDEIAYFVYISFGLLSRRTNAIVLSNV